MRRRGFYLKQDVAQVAEWTVHDLPETTAACTVHNGAYRRLSEAYDALLQWVAESGYQIAGPIRSCICTARSRCGRMMSRMLRRFRCR